MRSYYAIEVKGYAKPTYQIMLIDIIDDMMRPVPGAHIWRSLNASLEEAADNGWTVRKIGDYYEVMPTHLEQLRAREEAADHD